MSISPAAPVFAGALASSGRLRVAKGSSSRAAKSGEAALARIPFLANLILDRQAGGSGRATTGVFLNRSLRLKDILYKVVDGGFLAHMSSVRAFACFSHFPILPLSTVTLSASAADLLP